MLELQLMYDTYYAETVDALKIIRFVMKLLIFKVYLCLSLASKDSKTLLLTF